MEPVEPTSLRPPRRRGRTTALIAAAAALGTLAGTATGYALQYDRAPTPLPPLAQQQLPHPKLRAPGDATTNRSVNANRWHPTDGPLAKLLVKAPAGAKTGIAPADMGVPAYVTDFFDYPGSMFDDLQADGIRRVALTEWLEKGRLTVTVRLVQFRDRDGAEHFQDDQASYMDEDDYADNLGKAVPGADVANGAYWVYSKADKEAGYLPVRQARAVARRGDVVMDIWFWDNRGSISESTVRNLAKKQLERL
ncbi:hypothetical protein LG634_15335 [Streptomyces bambusae]|uniref:hypothetical protein n=1 Tax=Streptomyces bambusae TaxID=1550616 RepID=UPI001CFCF778|nr:hypothetical protein [Streptomyces bambusae]MCB5166201.1 hypothetical protein [Streptomyces bambusae]